MDRKLGRATPKRGETYLAVMDLTVRDCGMRPPLVFTLLIASFFGCTNGSQVRNTQRDDAQPAESEASLGMAKVDRETTKTSAANAATACRALCDVTAALACAPSSDECTARCQEMWGFGACANQMRDFVVCASGHSAGDFECDEEGQPSLKAGLCEAEQELAAKCVETM